MKNSIWKKGLTLAIAAMVLTTSVSLPADAAAAAPVAETQETQPGGEAARQRKAPLPHRSRRPLRQRKQPDRQRPSPRRRYRRLRRQKQQPRQAPVRIKIHPVTTTAAAPPVTTLSMRSPTPA